VSGTEPASTGEPGRGPAALRLGGALLLLAAASTFLVQQWDGGDDTVGYLYLLAHAVLIAGCGALTGLGVRAARSARTFFALLLGVLPVHFAVLGGLLQSRLALDPHVTSSAAPWEAPSALAAVLTCTGALAVLIPLTFVAVRVLARPLAAPLAALVLTLNAVLLIPVRTGGWVAALAVASMVWLLRADRDLARRSSVVHTLEGRLVRLAALAPIVILLGRSLAFYTPDAAFWGVLALGMAAGLAWVPVRKTAWAVDVLTQLVATLFASVGVWLVIIATWGWLDLHPDSALPAAGVLWAASLLTLAHIARRFPSIHVSGAVGALCLTALLEVFAAGGPWSHAFALTAGVACIGIGFHGRRWHPMIAGALVMGLTLGAAIHWEAHVDVLVHWVTLSLGGAALIGTAALVERKGPHLKRLAQRAFAADAEWEW
jgi:hypothetical protein